MTHHPLAHLSKARIEELLAEADASIVAGHIYEADTLAQRILINAQVGQQSDDILAALQRDNSH